MACFFSRVLNLGGIPVVRRGPAPNSADELARRGSWRAKARRQQENAAAALFQIHQPDDADEIYDDDAPLVDALARRLVAEINRFVTETASERDLDDDVGVARVLQPSMALATAAEERRR